MELKMKYYQVILYSICTNALRIIFDPYKWAQESIYTMTLSNHISRYP